MSTRKCTQIFSDKNVQLNFHENRTSTGKKKKLTLSGYMTKKSCLTIVLNFRLNAVTKITIIITRDKLYFQWRSIVVSRYNFYYNYYHTPVI